MRNRKGPPFNSVFFNQVDAIMPINRRFTLHAAALAAATMLVATTTHAVPAITGVCSDAPTGNLPSCTCKSPSGYTISLATETPAPTQTTYTYSVSGSGNAKVSAIRDVQVIIPRPVSTTNQDPSAGKGVIQDGTNVTGINTYCQADPNSGNNKGNCDGFLVHVAVQGANNASGTLNRPVGRNVADGMVTFNIIGGNGNTELCSAVDNNGVALLVPGGIAGPGDIGDPFQPKFATQDATVADGKCIAHLIFDKKGNVIDVTASNAPGFVPTTGETNCTVASPVVTPANPNADIIVNGAPLKNNTGPHGITFGTGTTTCYGPSIPSPAKCVCTRLPCP
jgi:hypothetical protein